MAGVVAGRRGFFEQLAAFEVKPAVGTTLWPFALVGAWAFDFLFWDKPPGISFPIYVVILLACIAGVAHIADVPIAASTKWLFLPVAFFAIAPAVRAEPLTMVFDYLAVLGLLGLIADALVNGGWIRYRIRDYIVAFVHLGMAGVVGGGLLIADEQAKRNARPKPGRRYKPVLRGILLALPLLLVFALLFASADPVFSEFVTSPFTGLDADALSEISFRILYVLVLAYMLTGIFLYAVRSKAGDQRNSRGAVTDDEGTVVLDRASGRDIRVLGSVEGSVVLASLNLLFGIFVIIQFRYFFGGTRAIAQLDMTYSEYARRGFAELVVVAILTLLLILGLSLVVRRESRREVTLFSALTSGIVGLTSVILVSAFQRLLLYEDAYGFTRLRTYSHVFMVWLALVLVAVLILQWKNSLHFLALVLLFAAIGFVISLNVLGVDSFIATRNVNRAIEGAEFDVAYLNSLSSDSIPTLVARVDDLPAQGRAALSNMLACKAMHARNREVPWQSIHLSRSSAKRALDTYYRRQTTRADEPECRPIAQLVLPTDPEFSPHTTPATGLAP